MPASTPKENHVLFQRLWNEGDVEGLLDLYEEDAVYVPVAGSTLTGRAAIREMLNQILPAGMKNELVLVNLVETGDLALERTTWTMTLPDGSTTSGRSTVILRRQSDGGWRMIVDDPGLTSEGSG